MEMKAIKIVVMNCYSKILAEKQGMALLGSYSPLRIPLKFLNEFTNQALDGGMFDILFY